VDLVLKGEIGVISAAWQACQTLFAAFSCFVAFSQQPVLSLKSFQMKLIVQLKTDLEIFLQH
jgi:hypothetical protein